MASAGVNAHNIARAALADQPSEPLPEIVVLCGSTRFYDEFQQANYDLTMQGKIVLSVGFYPHAKARHGHGEGVGHDSTEKVALDELHKRKIDLADRVLVLNIGGYIGESTQSEIDYAVAHGKPVDYAYSEVPSRASPMTDDPQPPASALTAEEALAQLLLPAAWHQISSGGWVTILTTEHMARLQEALDAALCEERERDLRQALLEASYFHVTHDGMPRYPETCHDCRRLRETRPNNSRAALADQPSESDD